MCLSRKCFELNILKKNYFPKIYLFKTVLEDRKKVLILSCYYQPNTNTTVGIITINI